MSKILTVIAAALLAAGCRPATPAAATSPADHSCEIATNANIRAEGILEASVTTATLSRASTIWRLASHKIENSGVPLAHTTAGHLGVDLDLAALAATQAVLEIDTGQPTGKTMNQLYAAERKIDSVCQ